MDVLLLRTLAWKSTLGFGKYYDISVLEVFNLKHTRYLRWCYFNCSMISFSDEILEAIYIRDEFKINKPGKDKEVGNKLNEILSNSIGKLPVHINLKKAKGISRAVRVSNRMRARRDNFRSVNQARNQGRL